MLIIVDASVIISTLVSRKKSYARDILRLAREKAVSLAICDETLTEIKYSLSKEKIKKLRDYSSRVVGNFIAWYQYNGVYFSFKKNEIIISARDTKDTIYIMLAEKSKAEYLVTSDKDLLVLKNIGKTKIRTPKDFIGENRLLNNTSKQRI